VDLFTQETFPLYLFAIYVVGGSAEKLSVTHNFFIHHSKGYGSIKWLTCGYTSGVVNTSSFFLANSISGFFNKASKSSKQKICNILLTTVF
jgi:hypothetical protein